MPVYVYRVGGEKIEVSHKWTSASVTLLKRWSD